MKKQLIIIGIVFILLVVGLSGCMNENKQEEQNDNIENKFVGTWSGTSIYSAGSLIITFSSDGTYLSNGDTDYFTGFIYSGTSSGTWKINEGLLVTHPDNGDPAGNFSYQFSNNDQKLDITNINEMEDADLYILNLIKQ